MSGDLREPSASIGEPGELTDEGDGIVNVPISYPPVRGGCRGTLTLVSAQALKVGASGIPMRVTLGSAPFLLGPGSRGELPVSIPATTTCSRSSTSSGKAPGACAGADWSRRGALAERSTYLCRCCADPKAAGVRNRGMTVNTTQPARSGRARWFTMPCVRESAGASRRRPLAGW